MAYLTEDKKKKFQELFIGALESVREEEEEKKKKEELEKSKKETIKSN